MNTHNRMLKVYLTLAILQSFMTGCLPQQGITPSPDITVTTQSTQSIGVFKTPTAEVSKSASTAIAISSPTLLPTLVTEQALVRIRELFETNGGCRLPCWWGFTPGVTPSDDAFNFIQSIGQNYTYIKSEDKNSETVYFYLFDLPQEMRYSENDYFEGRLYARSGKIIQIFISGFNWPSYHLSAFLLENGPPDEVWIGTHRLIDKNQTVPFNVYLFYSEKGMLASYGTWEGQQKEDKIIGCINASPNLLIWSHEEKLSFADARALIGGRVDQGEYKTVDEATLGKLTAELFYEKYQHINTVPCLETDADLWRIAN